jgi:uncharacterized membrane protein YczE
MPFFWNDSGYWKRMKSGNRDLFKIDIPLYAITLILWIIFMHDVLNWKELMLLALPSYLVVQTFINIFLQRPHFRIPDTYSKIAKTVLYIFNFILSCMLFYMIVVGVLQYHYVFFDNLVCCEFINNFPNLNLKK